MAKKTTRKKKPATTPAADRTPEFARVHIWQVQAFRDVLVVAAVLATFWAGYLLRTVTVPLLLALLLAYLFEPLVAAMMRRYTWSRRTVLIIILCAFVVVVGSSLTLATTLAVGQAITLREELRSGEIRSRLSKIDVPEMAQEPYDRMLSFLPRGTTDASGDESNGSDDGDASETVTVEPAESPARSTAEIEAIVDARIERLRQQDDAGAGKDDWLGYTRSVLDTGLRIVGTLISIGFLFFLVPFYFFFFSLWYHDVLRFARNLIPERNRKRTLELLSKMDHAVSGFVRGRIVISVIMGVLLTIGWMICGVPYAIALGMLTGIFCAIPYLGGLGVPLAIALMWFDRIGPGGELTTHWIWILTWPTVVFVIVQLIEGYILVPTIAGKATGLDPVTILVVVLAGGSVLGVYGMLLAIPIAACGKILIADVLMPKVRAWTKGQAADPLPIDR